MLIGNAFDRHVSDPPGSDQSAVTGTPLFDIGLSMLEIGRLLAVLELGPLLHEELHKVRVVREEGQEGQKDQEKGEKAGEEEEAVSFFKTRDRREEKAGTKRSGFFVCGMAPPGLGRSIALPASQIEYSVFQFRNGTSRRCEGGGPAARSSR